jgi:hypothetical protein
VRPGAGQIEMVIAKESSLVDEFVNILEQRASLEHSARREPTIALYRLEGYPQSFIDQVSLEKNFTLYESERSELTQTNSRVLFYPLQLSKAQAATELNAKGKAFQDATHKYLPQTAKKIQQKFERQKHHKDWK